MHDELKGVPARLEPTVVKAIFTILGLYSGIPRDGGLINLTKFIHPASITFNGIISNNATENQDILILDEAPVFKELGSAAVDALLGEKFAYGDKVPTTKGLLDIVNNNSTPDADDTAEALYYSLKDVLETNGNVSTTEKVAGLFTIDIAINLANVYNDVINEYLPEESNDPQEGLKALLRAMKFEIEIGTYPYAANKLTDYGTKNAPLVPTDYGCNPIVFWGLSKGLVLK